MFYKTNLNRYSFVEHDSCLLNKSSLEHYVKNCSQG